MYFTNFKLFVLLFFVTLEFILGIISAYGWLVEYSKRTQNERNIKNMFDVDMALLHSTDIKSHNYTGYLKEIEKSIIKERQKNDIFML